MPSGVYPRVKIGWKRPDKATPDVCRTCGVALVAGENWTKVPHGSKYCRACNNARSKAYYYKDPAAQIAKRARYYAKLRSEAYAAYGGRCVCCGESRPQFLTIDHVNGDGAEHRKRVAPGCMILQWLQQRGWPQEGFQLLCWNCNCAKGIRGGCPHEREPFPTSFPWAMPTAA